MFLQYNRHLSLLLVRYLYYRSPALFLTACCVRFYRSSSSSDFLILCLHSRPAFSEIGPRHFRIRESEIHQSEKTF